MRKLCVDRIIGDIVVCEEEDLTMTKVKRDCIPFDIYEGCILLTDGENYFQDKSEEEARRQRIIQLQNKLKNKK